MWDLTVCYNNNVINKLGWISILVLKTSSAAMSFEIDDFTSRIAGNHPNRSIIANIPADMGKYLIFTDRKAKTSHCKNKLRSLNSVVQ